MAGSSGRDSGDGIPALGIAPETAARLARRPHGWPKVTMTIETDEAPAETETLVYEYPGTTDEWVVLSAHVDGHDLAESAMDNGTGPRLGAGRDARAVVRGRRSGGAACG